MAVDEARRHALGVRTREALGEEEGETLMELLPPVGWADVATKHDLEVLGNELRAEMHDILRHQTIWLTGVVSGSLVGGIGVAAAVLRLTA